MVNLVKIKIIIILLTYIFQVMYMAMVYDLVLIGCIHLPNSSASIIFIY